MSDVDVPATLHADLRTAWHRWVDMLVPLRPALYGYCRRLTGNVWDAEDLAQETLLRAFGRWGVTTPAIREPRAYLLRTATNAWIDTLRRRETEARAPAVDPDQTPATSGDPTMAAGVRDAGARLLQRLSPQERAAVVLKEAFDMALDEIATVLATTTGAVKAALHRGRERLRHAGQAPAPHRPLPSPELLDRFIERYDAQDVPGLVALVLESGTAENIGNSVHIGLDPIDGVSGFFQKVVYGHAEWPPEFGWDSARLRRVELDGEPMLLYLVRHGDHEALTSIFRFEERDGRIAHLRSYGFCPDTVCAVAEVLGLDTFTGLYRSPTPALGVDWPDPDRPRPAGR
jgi:RNA polymerase sigma-70 factor, ECF subfamily